MALNNPNDPNSPYPNQPGSAFSFNFNPEYIAKLSANPTSAPNGGQAPSGFANLSQQSNQNTAQNNNPVAPSQPALQTIQTGSNIVRNATSSGSGPITSSINNFGGTLGFSTAGTQSAAAAAALDAGVTPGMAADGLAAGETSLGFGTDTLASASAGELSGATLSGTLGAAGLGYIGGQILGKAVGGSPIGGSIGGAVGAAAGMAFGGAGAAALGLELGSFAGPIGAVVGGIGGALFGSLFGGGSSPPTNADSYNANITPTGTINSTTTTGGSKNAGTVSGFGQQNVNALSNYASSAANSLGIKFDPNIQLGAEISTKHPGPDGKTAYVAAYNTKTQQTISGAQWFDPSNADEKQQAYYNTIQSMANASGYTNNDALKAWYSSYNSGTGGTSSSSQTAPEPSVPTNPTPSGTSDFQKFVDNYKAQQSVHSA